MTKWIDVLFAVKTVVDPRHSVLDEGPNPSAILDSMTSLTQERLFTLSVS